MSVYIFPDNHFILGNSKYLGIYLFSNNIPFHFVCFENSEMRMLDDLSLPYISLSDFNKHFRALVKDKDICFFSTIIRMRLAPEAYEHILKNAQVVQMWHGFPLKKIGSSNFEKKSFISNRVKLLKQSKHKSYLCVRSDEDRKRMFYSLAYHKFPILGSPRTDLFYRTTVLLDMINVSFVKYELVRSFYKQGHAIVMIMLTWIESCDLYDEEIRTLYNLARDCSHIVFIVKPHSNTPNYKFDNLDNFVVLDNHCDPYPFIKLADTVVTDFSSIAIDVMHLTQLQLCNLVFYHGKIHEYCKVWERGLYNNKYDEIGFVVNDIRDITKHIPAFCKENKFNFAKSLPYEDIHCFPDRNISYYSEHSECRECSQAFKHYIKFNDGRSSERIAKYFITDHD